MAAVAALFDGLDGEASLCPTNDFDPEPPYDDLEARGFTDETATPREASGPS